MNSFLFIHRYVCTSLQYCALKISTKTQNSRRLFCKTSTIVYLLQNLGNSCWLPLIRLPRSTIFNVNHTTCLMFLIEWQLSHECGSAINCLFLCGSDTLSTSFWCCFFFSWFSVNESVWVSIRADVYIHM